MEAEQERIGVGDEVELIVDLGETAPMGAKGKVYCFAPFPVYGRYLSKQPGIYLIPDFVQIQFKSGTVACLRTDLLRLVKKSADSVSLAVAVFLPLQERPEGAYQPLTPP